MIRYSFETVLTDLCPKILVAVILIISVILRWTVYGKKWSVCTPHNVLFSRLSVRPLRYNAHQTKKPTLGSLPPLSIWDNQEGMLTCMLELAGIDWRGALVSAGQACHTPCPCHASQPQSSHTDANQGRLPQKWFLKNVSKLQKRNWQEKSSFNQKKITQYVLFKIDKIEVCDNKCTPTIMQLWCKVPWLSPWLASPDMRMATACLSACR